MIVGNAVDKEIQCKKDGEGCYNLEKNDCCDGLKCFKAPFPPSVGFCMKPVRKPELKKEGKQYQKM